jgi:2-keto-4-pentenoate hydratase/2-oxohepta-3-ene-1,7-dioic acid hydratase in catechol pathway
MNWTQGKGLDGSCPIGPWIVLRDELPDPYPLRIRTWVNGDLRQDASTADMVHKIPALVAEITRGMTFSPGDIIATGTPEGTAMDSDATPFLRPGDVVRCEIEGIGILENPVGD